ncbi:MAG: TIGR00266 family protein [Acutalibacteraceae bacterium]
MNYKIIGEPLPVVICDVNPGETLITESGSMSWMSPNMKMETSGGSIGKALGRMFAGESLFQNRYTAVGGPGQIAFASSFPGSIKVFNITPENPMIVQKSGFLASEETVDISISFQKKFSTGFFGGEGFIMQKLSGNGIAFIEIDGTAVDYKLEAGQSMIIDTGYLAAMSATCRMEIVSVPGLKNKFFGGEGLFNTVVHGPGQVILQSMPKSAIAASLSFGTSNG